MANNFEALIRAVLDTTDFPNQVKKLDNKHFVKLGIDSQHLISEIRSALNTATFDININPTFNTKGAGKNLAKEVQSKIDTIIDDISINTNLEKIFKSKGIDDALSTKIIKSLNKDIGVATLSLKQLDLQFEKTEEGLKRLKSLKFTGVDDDGKTVSVFSRIDEAGENVTSELTRVTQKFGETARAIGASVSDIKTSIGNGEIDLAISKLTTQFQKLKTSGHASLSEISDDLDELRKLSEQLGSTNDSDLPNKYKELNDLLDKTKIKLGLVSEENKRSISSFDVNKLSNSMTTWLSKNTKASKEFGSQIDFLQNQLRDLNVDSDGAAEALNRIEKEFKDIQQQAIAAGLSGKSFGDRLKKALGGLAGIFTFEAVFDKSIELLWEMYQQVYDIDTAMVNLKKVTDETSNSYERFLGRSAESAKELGRSISSLVEQTASWAKLGYSIDEAEDLAKLSSIYANVAEVSDETAVKDMVTAMKAFNIEASKAVTVIDPLNELGNKFAVDAASLGDALSKSASAMNAAGTDMYKTLAMITGGSEITQNAGEFGNFLKVASMRLRGERYFIPIICESKCLQASINNYAA